MTLTILLNVFTVYVFYLFLLVAAHLRKPDEPSPAKSPVPPLVIRGHREALVTGDQQRECRENR
jgi:hypothetical protein